MLDADSLLVRTVAAADALRLPVRRWEGHISANREAGLALLPTHGVPVRVGGDAAARKSGERLITEAADAGLLAVTRYGRARYPYLRLTDTGEARARALAGLPGRAVGRQLLVFVSEHTDREPKTLEREWMDEVTANDGRGWGEDASREDRRQLAFIEIEYLSAASAGWLAAHSTIQGHARYRVTSAGWEEIDRPSKPPKVGKLPKEDAVAIELYRREQDARLAELVTSQPETAGDIGVIPLIVAHQGIPA